MSIEVTALVLRAQTGLNAQAKMVLLGLADHASNDGSDAWPSVATLAQYAECSERTVQRHLHSLVDAGLIQVQRESDRRTPTTYAVCLPVLATLRGDTVTPVTGVTTGTRGDNDDTSGVTIGASRGDIAVSPEPFLTTTVLEPSLAPRKRDALFDALVVACGGDPFGMTEDESRACGVAKAKILRASPDVTPEEFGRRADIYRSKFAHAALTPSAMARHWSECVPQTNGHAATVLRLAREMGEPV